jgi:hypothetical protein
LVGAVVLLGWAIDSATLKSVAPSFSQMKVNAALCFLLAGASLGLLAWRPSRTLSPSGRQSAGSAGSARSARGAIGRALAALLAAIALLTLCEYAFGRALGIDELLFDDTEDAAGTPAPGRMGANTALCFLLAGASLLLLDAEWRRARPAQVGALAIAVVAFVAVLGYAYGASNLSTSFITENVTPMALHTALAFLVLAAGLMLARPEVGMMVLARDPGPGGQLVRHVLAPTLLVPPLLGYLRLKGQEAGWYGLGEGWRSSRPAWW